MKKVISIFLVTVLCLSLSACGKGYNQYKDLLELVEAEDFDAAHELLNEMAGRRATQWVPECDVSDPWVSYDPCGDIGSGSDFWNGDNVCGDDACGDIITESEPKEDPVVEEPKEIPIEGILLSQTALTMENRESVQLTGSVYPENTTEYVGSITWKSSDESIVRVNEWNGLVDAKNCGTATITATMGDHEATCVVTVTNPTIASAEELFAIDYFYEGVVYEIVADIDMQGIEKPERMGDVYGIIEGNGHTIYNLSYGPVFPYIGSTGIVRNLTVECDVYAADQTEYANYYFSGIAGDNYGLVERCVTKGNVTIAVDYTYVGGIAKESRGEIYQCVNEINFTFGGTVINPLGVERKTALVYGGGIVCEGNARECYNIGNATFKEGCDYRFGGIASEPYLVEDCYNLGASNSKYAGGICGANFGQVKNSVNYGQMQAGITGHQSGYIIDCYYLKSKSPNEGITGVGENEDGNSENGSSARLYGLSDSAAGKQESYSTLDFENVWVMGPDGYPIFKWQQE